MRNLKKFLALVLAMVMAFSLMLTANAANTAKDFDDAANITEAFVEATDVLTGMKVFQGDEGGFRPGDQINRAEVAALIYRLATGDVDDVRAGTYANYGNFTDVQESDWFAGYVGYCANAGYIKGTSPTTFDPYAPVTGYETLAMILRAIGYDKNHEFEGSTWETNVSALATQLGILTNIKTTHYGNTLYLASRRDVVAELLFQADAKVPMVVYTPAFGYQQTGMSGGVVGSATNPTLGKHIFGLTLNENGVLLGNEQTGEGKDKSVLGYAGKATTNKAGDPIKPLSYTEFTWADTYNVTAETAKGDGTYNTGAAMDVILGNNVKYELKTGIDLIGHELKLWYDDGSGVVSGSKKHVYAYFDEAELTDVVVVKGQITGANTITYPSEPTDLTATADNYNNGGRNLYDLAKASGFKVGTSSEAVFNDSFGKFGKMTGTKWTVANTVADGKGEAIDGKVANTPAVSPVHVYKLISNNKDKTVDAVIALNIESSRITEANTVNRVPTIGMPVDNRPGNARTAAAAGATSVYGSLFVEGNKGTPDDNLKSVGGTVTGVIAQDALVGNSTKTLGDYEFGIHITGTDPRDVDDNEAKAINNQTKTNLEDAYFLLSKVTAPVEGTVVAYNNKTGTVTLDNGTVLNRSKYYHTVVGYNEAADIADPAPVTAIPQSWTKGTAYWEEGYANVAYKFYVDHEGKYLGAERTFGSTFLYGTYLDYSQETSSSTFNYYLTGVNLNGEIETKQVKRYWAPSTADDWDEDTSTTDSAITGTNQLSVPYRDSSGSGKHNIADGVYTGFTVTGTMADGFVNDPYIQRNEYLNNMRRLGIYRADVTDKVKTTAATYAMNLDTTINRDSITLGAEQVGGNAATNGRYFTEATKFILVEGYGTDSVKAEVYEGISKLKGTAAAVRLNLAQSSVKSGSMASVTATPFAQMTYYTESPYTYAQSGDTAMKVDTIILPKQAVTWSGGSGLYYVGDPTPTLVNSWGTDAWKYKLYRDGELEELWLTNSPTGTAAVTSTESKDAPLTKDTFLQLKDTGKTANDGEPIYTAGNYSYQADGTTTTNGAFFAGAYLTGDDDEFTQMIPSLGAGTSTYMTKATYSAVTRDAQTATLSDRTGAGAVSKLLRVAEAKVVNLNKDATVINGSSGEIWPNITDLTTLNEAGSIDPVTGRALKVSFVVDSNNPLVVTTIYVCWDQD